MRITARTFITSGVAIALATVAQTVVSLYWVGAL
jgi:hypothetical protein